MRRGGSRVPAAGIRPAGAGIWPGAAAIWPAGAGIPAAGTARVAHGPRGSGTVGPLPAALRGVLRGALRGALRRALRGALRGALRAALAVTLAATLAGCGGDGSEGGAGEASPRPTVVHLWEAGEAAFGVFVPDERPPASRAAGEPRPPALYTEEGGGRLADNPLYDFLFLNLEQAWDGEAVRAIARGVRAAGPRAGQAGRPLPTLLVRIPALHEAGEAATRERMRESLEAGADGIVLPHVRSAAEARTAIGILEALGADVWSPSNPGGSTILMLMLEDPEAVAEAEAFAALAGYSVLACGIGSLTRALGGDREAGEAGTLAVLDAARAAGLPDMITAGTGDVEQRLEEGFLALLMAGPEADEAIRIGRRAAGR